MALILFGLAVGVLVVWHDQRKPAGQRRVYDDREWWDR